MTTQEIPQVLEINCETGEELYRPMNAEELAAREQAQIDWEAEQAAISIEKAAKAEAKASAEAKLSALGLTAEEIAAL
jgi:hypothetical protein